MAEESTARREPRTIDLGGSALEALAASAPDLAEARPQKDTEPPSRTALTRQEVEALAWADKGIVNVQHRRMEAVLKAAQTLPRPHIINAIRNLERMGRITWSAKAKRYVAVTEEGPTDG